ncbi:diaminopropionate ammonia-lyase [Anaerovibrio sp.]|uniref:diaminopropionate ammonia-lyase n=1 Tax=Anaerovibrio sp. TaxID=1872532 RepID=UPI00388ECC92
MKEYRIGCVSVIQNTARSENKGPTFLSEASVAQVQRIHRGHPDYHETSLRRLDTMAERLGVKAFFVKDESQRFGLNAFKGLGGLYSITRVICRELGLDAEEISFSDLKEPEYQEAVHKMVFVTATDGNHGKGVSWAAGQLGCEAHVYMPKGSSELRAQAIRDVNPKAEVTITKTGYDDTVRYAAEVAEKQGWILIQDTSWDGYVDIPSWIIQGYTTMAEEASRQLEEQGLVPTHVFLQAGVGAMAGGVTGYLVNRYKGRRPVISVVEPENMACIYQSALMGDGEAHEAVDQAPTIMAGLNCGEPCTIAWPILRDFVDWYFKCPDYISAYGMRLLAAPQGSDPKVISGESGAVTTGLVNLIAGKEEYADIKKLLKLGKDSVVLCISTEGDTDHEHYREIIYEGKNPMPQQA